MIRVTIRNSLSFLWNKPGQNENPIGFHHGGHQSAERLIYGVLAYNVGTDRFGASTELP